MSPHAAQFSEALRALDLLMGWHGGWFPIDYDGDKRTYHRCGNPRGLVRMVRTWDERWSEEMLLRLPWPSMSSGGPIGATVLWARVEGKDQVARAQRFRPLPTMVIREGASSRRLLLWALDEWRDYFDVEKANKRIAYRLRSKQCDGLPERLRVPAPGTCLRVGRTRPVPVVVARLEPVRFSINAVAGRLKDPPPVVMPWERAA
jgi:hypothetical protein